jgi:hypothetical protein
MKWNSLKVVNLFMDFIEKSQKEIADSSIDLIYRSALWYEYLLYKN